MKPIKADDLKEFISSKREEWTVFASGPTKKGGEKSISVNLEQNKVKVNYFYFGGFCRKSNTHLELGTGEGIDKEFTSVTAAVEFFNNEEW